MELTATDGRHCHWTLEDRTLHKVKDIINGYVECCPYDCRWVIRGAGLEIHGRTAHLS